MLKYREIANELEAYIRDNKLQQGDKLPVLETLMTTFEASKSTITKALGLLEKKGVVFQVRGSGIFVRRFNRTGYISLLSKQGFKKSHEDHNHTSKILELDVRTPSEEVANNLGMSVEDEVYYVKRIQYVDGKALCIEESFYNKTLIPYLNKEIVSESIFNYITEALGLKIGFSDKYLHVDKINAEEAEFLGLETGDPKLDIETIYHLTNGQPFDYSKLTYNYKQSQFFIQENREL
ncbi:GntR family transcriptional regulator [Paenibacillus sp. FSL R7-0273]|uniref:GntR family transcriptional regulator n=1 Tax=Paenibacillus sp. FSL R7-0273 TaxID=1536772 RepID=UPI0004F6FAD8|nr:GntR family transcriptional regulator [Paenibacillus sp. FSL R7-0273]AIQ45779.1 GntR family transcriptional regulator [Paenibacillus sp. FSL R7-0273]OMF95304.1 GntR family transcriptional regulator [Paenibacillus sp. FSL R7-0273]